MKLSLPCISISSNVSTQSDEKPGHIVRTIETPEQVDKCIMNMLFDYKAFEFRPSTDL